MLKIKFILGDLGTEKTEPSPILKYPLEDYGISITNKNDADIFLIHSRIFPKYKNNSQTKIIIERADSSILYHQHVRQNIKLKNVLSVIKTTCLRDKNLNNSQVYSGRYHCKILNDFIKLGENENQLFKVEDNDLNKIKCLIPTSIQDRFYSYKVLKKCTKKYDIMFVGNICYNHIKKPNVLNWHREKAVEQLLKLKNKFKIFLHAEKENKISLPPKEYQKILNESKICLSPWGMGEWNYRDFECMYTKTILIKPNSNHVFCYPIDIFMDNKMYIPCNYDFSDLESKITMILDGYKSFEEMLEINNYTLNDSWNINKLANDFAYFIKSF